MNNAKKSNRLHRGLLVAISLFQAGSLAILPLSTLLFLQAGACQELAVTGAKIIPVVGEPIEQGTIVIREGRIAAIGHDVKIPVEARVIDATGKVIMPGFIEAHTSEPMSQANENNPNVPFVSVLDTIDPMRVYFDEARRNGITTVSVLAGNSTMIGGQGTAIKTGETFLDAMILERVTGMKISLSPAGGVSRMGQLAALRKELADAYKLAFPEQKKSEATTTAAKAEAENTEGDEQRRAGRRGRPNGDAPPSREGRDDQPAESGEKKQDEQPTETASRDAKSQEPPVIDALKRPMVDLVSGKMLAFIHCEIPMDVMHALSLIKEFNLRPVLILGRGCYKAAQDVVASGYPVIFHEDLVFWERDPRSNEDRQINVIEAFQDLQAPFALSVARAGGDTIGQNYLWYQAATAVKYGMPQAKALESLTIGPARMLGVDEFVGSLEVGKDGDLVILSGDPLHVDTWVDLTIVNGKIVYERENDPKLKLLLEGTK
ncbi:MAG TPA: amidohydrolase family protein [Pirellulaceae bacterium]|nr:amidohydrolase family protein [Pirellulaceae bacterium]HMO92313.1 amidohydrolase family protein [Pirellulaceae bacterium]HMP69237.1 amidohydrolase family protein [Pirellulaceae bacterium]